MNTYIHKRLWLLNLKIMNNICQEYINNMSKRSHLAVQLITVLSDHILTLIFLDTDDH